jgi:amino acid permease
MAEEAPPQFSFWVGVSFTLNYVVGSGFLTLPKAFQDSGPILGGIVLALFGFYSILSVYFLLESMDRAAQLFGREKTDIELSRTINSRNYSSIQQSSQHGTGSTKNAIIASKAKEAATKTKEEDIDEQTEHTNKNEIELSNRRIEITEMCDLFLGKTGKQVFSFIISVYMYGTMCAYCTVFAQSFEAEVGGEHSKLAYYLYLLLFAIMVIPLSLMEFTEQVHIQVALTIFRVVMLLIIILSTTIARYTHGNEFGPAMETNVPLDMFAMNFDKLHELLPIAAFAYVFHHSVPGLSEPIQDKNSLGKMFGVTLFISFAAYLLLATAVAAYFGSETLSPCNLNWTHYTGVKNADGSTPWYAMVISAFVLLFPAIDVASAYPLNAFTLGNNLMSTYYGEDMKIHEKSRWKVSMFRLLAAVPPFLGAILISDLTAITGFTGIAGFGIVFIFPPLLGYYSAKRLEQLDMDTDTVHSGFLTRPVFQYVLVISGVVFALVCTVIQIMDTVKSMN